MALRAKYTGSTLIFYDDAVGSGTPLLTIDSTTIANLASLVGISPTELGYLDGVVAGTTAASKAVVQGADSKVSALDVTLLKIGGVDKTTALAAALANPAVGVAAGYKVARGETALDGSNATPVATGLTTVIAFVAMLKGTAAPGVGTSVLTSNIAGAAGNVDVYAWKPTSNADPTLVASTGTESFYWVAIGT